MRIISGSARGTKLDSIESMATRPTLDRVKESLFNIIQNRIQDATVLDLFAGSGALGIECISRGCEMAYFCDQSLDAIQMINKNIERTHLKEKTVIFQMNYQKMLAKLREKQVQFDLIFIDPPYEANIGIDAIRLIEEYHLLKENGLIVLETDEEEREKKELAKLTTNLKVHDLRKYGRACLLFLN